MIVLFVLYFLSYITDLMFFSYSSSMIGIRLGYALLTFLIFFIPTQIYTRTRKKILYTDEYKSICILIPVISFVVVICLFILGLWISSNLALFIYRAIDEVFGMAAWGILSYKIGKKYLLSRGILFSPFYQEKLNLYSLFFSSMDVRSRQEVLLALASENKRRYSYFTINEWNSGIRNWFTSISTPELAGENAYSVLLCLISSKNTHDFAKIIIDYYDKSKGMPNPKARDEIISLINRYWQQFGNNERVRNPYIDDIIVQEMQAQYSILKGNTGDSVSNIVITNNTNNVAQLSNTSSIYEQTNNATNDNKPFDRRIQQTDNNKLKKPEEQLSNSDSAPKGFVYAEAANGMTVRIPMEKFDKWQATQNKIREQMENGTYSPNSENSNGLMELLEKSFPKSQPVSKETHLKEPMTAEPHSRGVCPNCNTPIPKDSTFCFRCGFKQRER